MLSCRRSLPDIACNDTGANEIQDACGVVTEDVLENSPGVLTDSPSGMANASGRCRQAGHDARHGDASHGFIGRSDNGFARGEVRICEDVRYGVNAGRGHGGRCKFLLEYRKGMARGPIGYDRVQCLCMTIAG